MPNAKAKKKKNISASFIKAFIHYVSFKYLYTAQILIGITYVFLYGFMIIQFCINSFPYCKILDLLKLNAFADQKLYATCNVWSVLG